MANKENIQKWVDALRSGEYDQGFSRLETLYIEDGEIIHRKLCCLGVACRVFMANNPGEMIADDDIIKNRTTFVSVKSPEDFESGILPNIVKEWLEVVETNPIIRDAEGHYHTAASLNDSGSYTFEGIADLLERSYLSD